MGCGDLGLEAAEAAPLFPAPLPLWQFVVQGDSEPLAVKKFENFCEYLALYPEFSFIFIGDNGQGDVRTAEMVLSDPRYSGNLQRTYIHEVPHTRGPTLTPHTTLHSFPLWFHGAVAILTSLPPRSLTNPRCVSTGP